MSDQRKVPFKQRGTDRRRDWLQSRKQSLTQIRKQKREEALQRKRYELSSNADGNLAQRLEELLQTPSLNALSAVEKALGDRDSATVFDTLLKSENIERFLQILGSQFPNSLPILLFLSTLSNKTDDYYGRRDTTWPSILLAAPIVSKLLENLQDETVSNVLGNQVLEEPSLALKLLAPYWKQILLHNNTTLFLIAAIIRVDQTTYGVQFLEDFPLEILRTNRVEVAWIIEGLTRREDECISMLCGDGSLYQSIVDRLASTDPSILVPLLQAVSNILVSCQGRYLETFLSQENFVTNLERIVDQRLSTEAITVMACFLHDVGLPIPLCETAERAFLPILVKVVQSGVYSVEWKQEALHAIVVALREPDAPLEPTIMDTLVDIVRRLAQRDFMQSLIDLLTVDDVDLLLDCLEVLDRLIRNVPESQVLIEEMHGIDHFNRLCEHSNEDVSMIVGRLMDDVFEKEEEENEDIVAPLVSADHFHFGLNDTTLPPRGRGRGRIQPAWMKDT